MVVSAVPAVRAPRLQSIQGSDHYALKHSQRTLRLLRHVSNLRKGNRLPRECNMLPRQTPRQPTSWELQENGRAFPPNYLHESWQDYLYWDTELEP